MSSLRLVFQTAPSVNNLYMTVGKRRMRVPSYKEWQHKASNLIKLQYGQWNTLTEDCELHFYVERFKTKHKRDITNLIKASEDILVQNAIIKDDQIVRKCTIEWVEFITKPVLEVDYRSERGFTSAWVLGK